MNSEQERLIRLIMTQILIFKKQYILKLEMLRIYEGILTVTQNDCLIMCFYFNLNLIFV